jgi:hypothetical protein
MDSSWYMLGMKKLDVYCSSSLLQVVFWFLPGSGLTTFFILPLIFQKSVDATPRLLKTFFCHYNLDCRDRNLINRVRQLVCTTV